MDGPCLSRAYRSVPSQSLLQLLSEYKVALVDVISRSFQCPPSAKADRAPLANAQIYMLRTIEALVGINNINVTLRVDLSRQTTAEHVAARVQAVIEAYPAFRTLFPRDDNGVHYQQLAHEGTFEMAIISADERSVDEEVRACLDAFLADPFRIEDTLPFRCGLITKDGVPAVLAMAFSHLILDRWSLLLVRRGLQAYFDDDNANTLPGVQEWSPIDQGNLEQSEAVRSRVNARLAYWRDTLAQFPPEMLQVDVSRPSTPGHWRNIAIQSGAIHAALVILSKKYNIPSGTILLGVFASAFSQYFGLKIFAAESMFSNRVDHISQTAVGQYAQTTPFVIEMGGDDFGIFLTQLQGRLLRSYGNASVPPGQTEEIFDAIGAQRIAACFNIDHSAHSAEFQDLSAEQLRAKLDAAPKRNIVEDMKKWDYDWSRIYIESHSPRDILMRVDTRLIPLAAVHEILAGIEALLVDLAATGSTSFWPVAARVCPRR